MSEPDRTSPTTASDSHAWSVDEPLRDLSGMTLGDFEVERLLGRGGMGEVYLARQVSLNRPVALKVLRPDMLTRPDYLLRFEAEAAAVAKLNHPNIVHIYTLGQVDAIRFIAMEYVQGMNLRDYINKKGALDLPLAMSIIRQAGVAIGAAGERGLIHRDIKPENLLMTKKGQVKVADFGLCRDKESEVRTTQTGVTLGTPQYMSPEQIQGHALDHRSDLYSLGVTSYHILAGVPPYRAETPLALAMKHLNDVPVSLRVHRPEVPAELDRLVLKLMAKRPEDRYQSAGEMLRDLAKVRESMNAPSMAVPIPDASTATATAQAIPAINGNPKPSPKPAPKAAPPAPKAPPSGPAGAPGPAVPRLSRGALSSIVAGALAAGLAWGWLSRPPDLLSEKSGSSATAPGLLMEPQWQAVPRKGSAEEQYHAAQVGASEGADPAAAWVAVAGHFPAAKDWSSRAYVQLGRLLLRRRDVDRLRELAAEVTLWNPGVTHERELAEVLQAGVKALEGDVAGVIDDFNGNQRLDHRSMIDPALLELSLEVAAEAARSAPQAGGGSALREIERHLLDKLYFEELRVPLGPGPGRPG